MGRGEFGGLVGTLHHDRLASRGVRFKSAYRPAPVCVASWGSLITGLYPPRWEAKFLEDALPAGTRKIAGCFSGTRTTDSLRTGRMGEDSRGIEVHLEVTLVVLLKFGFGVKRPLSESTGYRRL